MARRISRRAGVRGKRLHLRRCQVRRGQRHGSIHSREGMAADSLKPGSCAAKRGMALAAPHRPIESNRVDDSAGSISQHRTTRLSPKLVDRAAAKCSPAFAAPFFLYSLGLSAEENISDQLLATYALPLVNAATYRPRSPPAWLEATPLRSAFAECLPPYRWGLELTGGRRK